MPTQPPTHSQSTVLSRRNFHVRRLRLGGAAVVLLGALLLVTARPASTETEAVDLDTNEPLGLEAGEHLWELTLATARNLGLEQSLTLKRSSHNEAIQAASKTIAQAQFDWIFTADTRYSRLKDRAFDNRNHTMAWDNTMAIVRSFPTGTHLRTSLFYSKSEAERPDGSQRVNDSVGLSLSLEQNLLRGFGTRPNLYSIELADIGIQIERSRFNQEKKELIFAIDQAYWNLVFAHADLSVTANSLALSREDLSITQRRRRSGTATDNEVTAAEFRLAQKEQEMLERQRAVRDRSDSLLRLIAPQRLLALLTDAGRRHIIVPVDYDTSAAELPEELDVRHAIAQALRYREELRQAGMNIDSADLTMRQREHEMLPELNAVAGLSVGGGGYKTASVFDSWSRTDTVSWFLGLEFAMPIDNSAARGRNEEAQHRRLQAGYDEQLAQVEVITDVLAAVREVRTTRQTMRTAAAGERHAEQQVRAATRRHAEGLGTRFELDSFREDLDIARRNRRQAEVSLRIALSRLQLSMGTIGR